MPQSLRDLLDTTDTVYLSIASLWEIAIKVQLGKLALNRPYEAIGTELAASDILLLPITVEDTVRVRHLPSHHRDPFDRMLISQALNNDLVIVSKDTQFDAYAVDRQWM
jgi:PIN domain nuclease of toxin-antitoxin system